MLHCTKFPVYDHGTMTMKSTDPITSHTTKEVAGLIEQWKDPLKIWLRHQIGDNTLK